MNLFFLELKFWPKLKIVSLLANFFNGQLKADRPKYFGQKFSFVKSIVWVVGVASRLTFARGVISTVRAPPTMSREVGEELVIEDWVAKVENWNWCRFYLRLLTRDLDTECIVWAGVGGLKWAAMPGDSEVPQPSPTAIETAIAWMKDSTETK